MTEKPTHPIVSTREVVSGIYGTCPRCADLCHIKPNPDRNRLQFKAEVETYGRTCSIRSGLARLHR